MPFWILNGGLKTNFYIVPNLIKIKIKSPILKFFVISMFSELCIVKLSIVIHTNFIVTLNYEQYFRFKSKKKTNFF